MCLVINRYKVKAQVINLRQLEDVIPALNTCDQLATLRHQYRTAFLSFLNDDTNKLAYFDRTSGIVFRQNFQEPGITPEKVAPSLLSSVTDCD